jgi:salicylate hydroxylase
MPRRRAVQLEVGWEFRRWEDGTILSAEDLAASCRQRYGEEAYTAHRADLLAAIAAKVPVGSLRLGHEAVEVDRRGDVVRIAFADRTRAEADILIGADGVHSIVRSSLFGASAMTDSGICAFRALVPAQRAPAFALRPAQTLWIGPGHHLVHYPVCAGEFVNLVAFAPANEAALESWSATATVEEFLAEFDGWDARLVNLIRAGGTPGRWALVDREPLPQWSVGGTTLLGDAAHPMFPFFAQGAAQAIEDASVLARCVAEGLNDPAGALQRYESIRIRRTTKLQTVSHGRSHINHLPDGAEQRERDADYAQQDPLIANGWIYGHDPDDGFAEPDAAAAPAAAEHRLP